MSIDCRIRFLILKLKPVNNSLLSFRMCYWKYEMVDPVFFLWSKIPFEINKVVLFASVYNLLLSSYVVYISVNVLPRIFGKKFGNGFELFKVVHWCICLILYFKVSNTAIQKNDPLSSFMGHMTHIYAQKFIIFKTLCVFVCVWLCVVDCRNSNSIAVIAPHALIFCIVYSTVCLQCMQTEIAP